MTPERVKNVIEAALLAADCPLSLDALTGLFQTTEQQGGVSAGGEAVALVEVSPAVGVPSRADVHVALEALAAERTTS